MKALLWTYNEKAKCENNYYYSFADYEDLLLHIVEIGDDGYKTEKIEFL